MPGKGLHSSEGILVSHYLPQGSLLLILRSLGPYLPPSKEFLLHLGRNFLPSWDTIHGSSPMSFEQQRTPLGRLQSGQL